MFVQPIKVYARRQPASFERKKTAFVFRTACEGKKKKHKQKKGKEMQENQSQHSLWKLCPSVCLQIFGGFIGFCQDLLEPTPPKDQKSAVGISWDVSLEVLAPDPLIINLPMGAHTTPSVMPRGWYKTNQFWQEKSVLKSSTFQVGIMHKNRSSAQQCQRLPIHCYQSLPCANSTTNWGRFWGMPFSLVPFLCLMHS